MAEAVYVLCALTSIGCAFLLWRGYRANGSRLLFWSGVCFAGLAVNNILLVVDLMVWASVSLAVARSCVAIASLSVMLYGLIWEPR
jgi:hypothetical protein